MGQGDLFLVPGIELNSSGSKAMVAGCYTLGGSRPIGETQAKKQRGKLPGEESAILRLIPLFLRFTVDGLSLFSLSLFFFFFLINRM